MSDDTVEILNDLIETSKDGEKGFAKAATDAKDARLKSMFTEGAGRCRDGAAELQAEVKTLGGDAEKSGSLTAAAHRGWMDVKTAVTSRDDQAILDEVERGEDYAKSRYADALKKDLPSNIRNVLQRQYSGVLANHDRVRTLRNEFKDAR